MIFYVCADVAADMMSTLASRHVVPSACAMWKIYIFQIFIGAICVRHVAHACVHPQHTRLVVKHPIKGMY